MVGRIKRILKIIRYIIFGIPEDTVVIDRYNKKIYIVKYIYRAYGLYDMEYFNHNFRTYYAYEINSIFVFESKINLFLNFDIYESNKFKLLWKKN